jgi:hypothetical protein
MIHRNQSTTKNLFATAQVNNRNKANQTQHVECVVCVRVRRMCVCRRV